MKHLFDLLGCPHAVLLPIRRGTKAAMVKGWPDLTFDDTQSESYQRLLKNAGSVAVSLGSPSGGVCSIDFDDEDALGEFLRVNPFLENTLRTTAERGANLWIKLTGDIPPGAKFKDALGNALGEWRSDRNYTILSGTHPSGMAYKVVVDERPLEIAFGELKWPQDWSNTPTLNPLPKKVVKERPKIQRVITTPNDRSPFQNDIEDLKERYRIHDAWEDLDLPGESSNSCHSPLREDNNKSFSVFDGGRKWKDHGTGEHGDVIDLVNLIKGYDAGFAVLWIQERINERFNPFFGDNNLNNDEHTK